MRWGGEHSRPTSVHPGHSPSHPLGSSGPGDSHGWAADMMEEGLALLTEVPPRGELSSLQPWLRKGSESQCPSHQAGATSPAPPARRRSLPSASNCLSRSTALWRPPGVSMRTILAGRQPKALGLVYRDLRRDVHGTQKRCTCACAKTPPDAHTQSGLPWEAARIRAGNLRWLPHSFSLQETKGSFLCFWKNPHPSAQSRRWQRTGKGDPHQQGTSRVFWSALCQEFTE